MEKNNPKLELTQDEKGQLNGGYALQSSTTNGMENHFFSDNGNCKGDGCNLSLQIYIPTLETA